jgi:hypothetical protein
LDIVFLFRGSTNAKRTPWDRTGFRLRPRPAAGRPQPVREGLERSPHVVSPDTRGRGTAPPAPDAHPPPGGADCALLLSAGCLPGFRLWIARTGRRPAPDGVPSPSFAREPTDVEPIALFLAPAKGDRCYRPGVTYRTLTVEYEADPERDRLDAAYRERARRRRASTVCCGRSSPAHSSARSPQSSRTITVTDHGRTRTSTRAR